MQTPTKRADTIEYVTEASRLPSIAQAVAAAQQVGLDTETAAPGGGGSLDPRTGRIRLLSLTDGKETWVIDCDAVPKYGAALFPALEQTEVVGHNLAFDLEFLRYAGWTNPGKVLDTMLVSQILASGRTWENDLASVALRALKVALPKAERNTDWNAAELTARQIEYAAMDVRYLLPIAEKLCYQARRDGLEKVVAIENRCLPMLVWMSASGVGLDRVAWGAIIDQLQVEAEELGQEMNRLAPRPGSLFDELGWSWDDAKQWKAALAACGYPYPNYRDATLALWDHPIAKLVRKRTGIKKRIAAFGEKWLSRVSGDRIHPRVHQLRTWRNQDDEDDEEGGAVTGRLAYSNPNLQQMPRPEKSRNYRKCFVSPEGRVLIKADYSQVEVRGSAFVAQDKFLLDAYNQGGVDIYKLIGARVLKKDIAAVTKDDRQIAKSLVLGLQYGMGADGLIRYAKKTFDLDFDRETAVAHRTAFFDLCTGLREWHRREGSNLSHEVRTLTGRRRLLNADDGMTVRCNTTVQGSCADGVKRACALLWERRDRCPGAFPVLCVHDEIVVECDADKKDETKDWLVQAMLDGTQPLLPGMPVEVEPSWGTTWAAGNKFE